MSNLPAKHVPTAKAIYDLVRRPEAQQALTRLMGGQDLVDKFGEALMLQVAKNPALWKCSEASLWRGIKQGADLRLSFSPTLGQAYLVPYGDECTFIVGYRGLITVAARSQAIKSIKASAVFMGEALTLVGGADENIIHQPDPDNSHEWESLRGCYAVAVLGNGAKQFDWMNKGDIEAIRARSRARNGPWHGSDGDKIEMGKKSVLKRLLKVLPMSPDDPLAIAFAADQEIDEPAPPLAAVPGSAAALNASLSGNQPGARRVVRHGDTNVPAYTIKDSEPTREPAPAQEAPEDQPVVTGEPPEAGETQDAAQATPEAAGTLQDGPAEPGSFEADVEGEQPQESQQGGDKPVQTTTNMLSNAERLGNAAIRMSELNGNHPVEACQQRIAAWVKTLFQGKAPEQMTEPDMQTVERSVEERKLTPARPGKK